MARLCQAAVAVGLVLTATGCATNYASVYDMRVERVERQERGSSAVTQLAVDGNTASDDLVQITWRVSNRSISLLIANKTDQSVKVIWDEATFMNRDGSSLRLVHRGIKSPEDVEFSHLPSVIPRGGKLEDSVYPADLIYRSRDKGWVRMPLIEEARAKAPTEAMRQGNQRRGQAVRVFLLLDVGGRLYEYVATLIVEGVTVWELDPDGDEPLERQPIAES